MKQIFIVLLISISVNVFGQDYWTDNYKVISSVQLSESKLTLEKKLNLKDYRVNPDGWKFYKTTLAIGLEKNGKKTMNIIETDIYTCANYTTAMIPCMLADPNKNLISIFTNSKASDRMYGMEGFVYQIDLNNKTWNKETIFKNGNFGWYSFFGGSSNGNPELCHFSYAGYYSILTTKIGNNNWKNENVGNVRPEIADKQYYTHSNILFTSVSNADRMKLAEANYYANYQPNSYNNSESTISLSDIIEGIEIGFATYKTVDNTLTAISTIFSTEETKSSSSPDDYQKRILSCLSQNKISAISDNPYFSAALSESVRSVIEKEKLSLGNIASSSLENLVTSDLNKKGYSSLTQMLEATSFIKCLAGK
jgi:hypothetical protein